MIDLKQPYQNSYSVCYSVYLHSTRKSIGSTMENTIIINFNNFFDFDFLIQHVKQSCEESDSFTNSNASI